MRLGVVDSHSRDGHTWEVGGGRRGCSQESPSGRE